MGDRVSVQFQKDKEKSVVLFSHYGGIEFVNKAKDYAKQLVEKTKKSVCHISTPIDRLEPRIVMVDFIRELTKDMDIVDSDYYLGKNEKDGDNSDNGHFLINFDKI